MNCKGRLWDPTCSAPVGRKECWAQWLHVEWEALEVLGILLKFQNFSQNPAKWTSALANHIPTCTWTPGLSPHHSSGQVCDCLLVLWLVACLVMSW